jgi:hypothetical protein
MVAMINQLTEKSISEEAMKVHRAKEVAIISILKEAISSEATIKAYRVLEKYWTRKRELTFEKVTVMILQGHKFAMQNNVNKFYQAIDRVADVPTASAYCQARLFCFSRKWKIEEKGIVS